MDEYKGFKGPPMTLSQVLKVGDIVDERRLELNSTENPFWKSAVARDFRMNGQKFWPFATAARDVC